MPIVLKRKIVKIGNSLRVTLPSEVCELLKIKEGDTLEFYATDSEVAVRKAKT